MSKKGWSKWIAQQLEEHKKVYKYSPERLIAEYRREKASMHDYQGRELLELLQNANDAAAADNKKCRVKIRLCDVGIAVGNTGQPFSKDGIKSLMISDLSPKSHSPNLIGDKGLGLRALLNWCSYPIIISGNLSLTYSKEYTEEWLYSLCDKEPDISKAVNKEKNQTHELPVPKLLVPIVDREVFEDRSEISDKSRCLIRVADEMHRDGLDTVVAATFDNQDQFSAAAEQIENLRSEILLLVKNIESIEIFANDTKSICKLDVIDQKSENFDYVILRKRNGEKLSGWKRWKLSGSIPKEDCDKDNPSNSKYEVVVAVPDDPNNAPSALFTYFPTKINLNYSALCHATLDLTSNRDGVRENNINKYVLSKLATLLAKISEYICSKDDPWAACNLLLLQKQHDETLKSLGFYENLIKNAKNRKIVPVVSGEFKRSSDVRRLPWDYGDWLPQIGFGNFALSTTGSWTNKYQFLEALNIPFCDICDFIEILRGISTELNINERTNLISGLAENYNFKPETPFVPLWINAQGNLIKEGDPIFIPPASGELPEFPVWANVEWLNPKFLDCLKRKLETKDNRQLSSKIQRIGEIHEFNRREVAQSLTKIANRYIEEHKDLEEQIRLELLHTLWKIFNIRHDKSDRRLLDNLQIYVRTNQGKFKPANCVYFSKNYNDDGEVVERLYSGSQHAFILGNQESMGLNPENDHIQFFKWLGVQNWPRLLPVKEPSQDYIDQELNDLNNPVRFDDANEVYEKADISRVSIKGLQVFHDLEHIVENAPFEAILTWLAKDGRASEMINNDKCNGTLTGFPPRKSKSRKLQKDFRNYSKWIFSNTSWVPTKSGKKKRLVYCSLISENTNLPSKFLSPISFSEKINKFFRCHEVEKRKVLRVLEDLGVPSCIDDLDWVAYYNIISSLPKVDPNGEKAKFLYNLFLQRKDISVPDEIRYDFISNKKMWGIKNETGQYFSIGELYYLDIDHLSDDIKRQIPLVAIDRKRGGKKVSRLFGIKTIKLNDLCLKIEKSNSSDIEKRFNEEFSKALPYLYSLRVDGDFNCRMARKLSSLKIRFCSSLRVTGRIGNQSVVAEISPGSWHHEKEEYFLKSSEKSKPSVLKDMKIVRAVSEIVCNILPREDEPKCQMILCCTKEEKKDVLEGYIGSDWRAYVEAAKKNLNLRIDEDTSLLYCDFDENEDSVKENKTERISSGTLDSSEKNRPSDDVDDLVYSPNDITKVSSIPKDYVALPSPQRISIRITKKKRNSKKGTVTRYRIADGNRCEQICVAFEKSDGQNRLPIRVDHIQGYDGPKCDILSFEDREKLEEFTKTLDYKLVDRFIEVKGKTDYAAKIDLGNYQLDAAQEYDDRYWLYRVYEYPDGRIDLIALNNPIEDENARTWWVKIDPLRASEADQYEIEILPAENA